MGIDDTDQHTTTTQANKPDQEQASEDNQKVVSLFDRKLKKISDEELISECLLHLRFVESGLLTPSHKAMATLYFTEATVRPSLEYIKNDFLVALKVLKLL